MSTPSTAAELREAQTADWSQYVAVVPIDINGVRAFNVGDPVHVDHVDRKVVTAEQVAKTTTKAGRAAAGITEEGK